jgi:hypothetical protein
VNCLDSRREKLADPRRLSAEAQLHLRGCAPCTAFSREIDESEARLAEAFSVRLPEGLADRILLGARRSGTSRWAPWALAAGVVLALALAWNQLDDSTAEHYARSAIEHVLTEPGFLTEVQAGAPAALQAAVQEFGGSINGPIGRARVVKVCPAGDGRARHIVLETNEGLATVILVPGKHVASAATANANGLSALVQPAPRGHYVIVTASQAATAGVDRLIRKRVEWRM